jgi:N-acetylneuraminic acid mutarotase
MGAVLPLAKTIYPVEGGTLIHDRARLIARSCLMNTWRRSWNVFFRLGALIYGPPAFGAELDNGGGGTWITTAPYPLFASEHNAAVVDNKIYVAGGFAGPNQNFSGTTNAFHVYDPSTDRWTSLAPLPRKLHHFGIAALDDKIYVTGGYTDDDFELDNKAAYVFDPRSANGGNWAPIADLPTERAAHSSVAVNGLLYVVGGVGSDAAALRAYNPATNTWDAGRPPLPTLREHLTAAVVNNRIYVISGRWSAGNVGTVEEYDPATNTWRTRTSIPTPRSGITSGVIDGRIHVTAGEGHPSGATLSSHEVYDPGTDTWATFPRMPTARHGLASGVVNGRWYVIGGGLLEGGGTFSSLSNVVEAFAAGPVSPGNPNAAAGRIANVSVLTALASPGESFSLGFVVGGGGTGGAKPLLVRAVGPSLLPFVGAGALDDPRLELFAGANRTAENDNWGGAPTLASAMAGVGAFALAGAGSRDAAVTGTLSPGDHSVRISASGNGTGTVLAEIYETPVAGGFTSATPRLVNVSVIKQLDAGLTLGFVIAGAAPRTVLIRAVGPTLGSAPFNLGGVAADPQLALYAGTTRTGENNDWGGTAALIAAFAQAGAFALPPGSRDAALVASLAPGNYSVQVSGVGATTGTVLVEAYEMR